MVLKIKTQGSVPLFALTLSSSNEMFAAEKRLLLFCQLTNPIITLRNAKKKPVSSNLTTTSTSVIQLFVCRQIFTREINRKHFMFFYLIISRLRTPVCPVT